MPYKVGEEPSKLEGAHQSQADQVFVISENLGYLAALTFRLISRDLDRRFRPHGSSFGQWPVLVQLWAQDGLTQRELCQKIVVEEATLTNTLSRMEKVGVIERRREGRVRRVFLTEKSRHMHDTLISEALASNELVMSGLTQAEKAELMRLLRLVIETLQKQPGFSLSFV